MNRIDTCFAELKEKKQKALNLFITAGAPSLKATEELILAFDKAGASVIELGVPFSDPMADGPVIQASSEVALANGVTLAKVLKLVEGLRKKTQIPIVLMGYLNPIHAFGYEAFADAAAKAGVDGVLTVDLPPEEAEPLHGLLKARDIHSIFLLAPTSSFQRVKAVRKFASGFVYYVSLTGVTGAELSVDAALKKHVAEVRHELSGLPVCVGFGISTDKQAKAVAEFADGVVVGSALVKLIAESKPASQAVKRAKAFVEKLRKAV